MRIRNFIDNIQTYAPSKLNGKAAPFHAISGGRNYQRGCRIFLNSALAYERTGASAFVCQVGAKRPGMRNTRFSWNPATVDSEDIAALVFGPNGLFNINSALLYGANISQLDLAVDVPGLRVDDVLPSYGKLRCTENRFGSGGRTLYLGARSGDTRVRIYDKRPEMIASNRKLGAYLAELHEPVPEHDLLRLEVSLRDCGQFDKLHEMNNPFLAMRVHMCPPELSQLELATVRLARYEGLATAFKAAKFSNAQKKALVRKLAKRGTPDWWRPKELWPQQFPALTGRLVGPFEP
jgi:hypothetical protein